MAKRNARVSLKPGKSRAVLTITHPNAAGIDIGSASHLVAVPPDRDDEPVREFPSFTVDLNALADWLKVCGIETVAMESTGVYWIPLFELLESRGFTVLLVNACHVKSVSGRKSDVLDCQWLQQLMTYGLLSGAFRPAEQVFTGHGAFDAFDNREDRRTIVFELLGTVGHLDAGAPADVFVIGALVSVLESSPAADVINQNYLGIRFSRLDILEQLLQGLASIESQTALASIGIGTNNLDPAVGIFARSDLCTWCGLDRCWFRFFSTYWGLAAR